MIKGAAYKTKVLFYEVRIIETPLNYQHLFRRRSTEMLKQRIASLGECEIGTRPLQFLWCVECFLETQSRVAAGEPQ